MQDSDSRAGGNGKGERRSRSDGLLTTGDMARLSNNTLRTVRFYEEAGILRPDRRSAGGHRLFSHRELERLQFISDMRAAGLSLEEIRALLELKLKAESGSEAAGEAVAALGGQIQALEDKIAIFTRLREELVEAHAILSECRTCSNERCFPDQCDDCDVITSHEGRLPKSMRVLWAVEGQDADPAE